MTKNNLKQRSKEAVEDKLGLGPIIEAHKKDYLDTLTTSHRNAQVVSGNSNLAFFADVIPWIASLIQVYTDQQNFLDAIKWSEKTFPGTTKPISMLTVLTTVYLIETGCDTYAGTPQAAVWKAIHGRLSTLLEGQEVHDDDDRLKPELA